MDTETNPIKDAAHAYADRGFRIIPLHRVGPDGKTCSCKNGRSGTSAGKHPLANKWQLETMPSAADIETIWGGQRVPNIGIVTGPESNILVVDIDGDKGQESMKALIAEHGAMPRTKMAKTGSGGYHFLFNYPDFEVGNSASTKLGEGIDTRGKGGFIVAAPSISGKGPYSWVESRGDDIVDAPPWLLELLRPKQRKEVVEPKKLTDIDPAERQRLDGYTEGAVRIETDRLTELTAKGWDGPPWDITTYEVACNLIQLANAPWSNLTAGQAWDIVLSKAPRDEGFDDHRVIAKWESALNTVGDNEAAYPPKPSSAFWVDEDEAENPLVTEPVTGNEEPITPTSDVDDFMADATAEDAITVTVPATLDGIPVAKGTLVPNYVELATAAAMGPDYDPKAPVDVVVGDAVAELRDLIRDADARIPGAEEQSNDIEPVDAWIGRNLKSGTRQLLWAAVDAIIVGMDTGAPTIVFKGGAPLLRLLALVVRPEVSPDPELLLAGPRISTREVDGDQIVFEFDDEDIDLSPYANRIIIEAGRRTGPLRTLEPADHDALEELEDYRAAQIARARLGIGSRRRTTEEGDH